MTQSSNSTSMSYETIKVLAKQVKRPVNELIALSPQNDPFYVGTERDKSLGAWFRDLWHEFGYSTGVHIRRMHYAIVSQNPPVKFPNGNHTKTRWSVGGSLVTLLSPLVTSSM